ncbi:MAG: type II toxin-antitoxin system RelE/ParE family toxin [Sphingomonadales bacterium]|nr:type II toxin-antitoxin system RelE/ParE family toxin [Sphingomonadales bacterium]
MLALYDWIDARSDARTAYEYTAGIRQFAESLSQFPRRGTPRDDLALDTRTLAYRRKTVIAYRVADDAVFILRLIHRGQVWNDLEFD